MSARPVLPYHAVPAPGPRHLEVMLARARQEDLMRAAIQARAAAEIRRSRGSRRYRRISEPVRHLAGIRPRKAAGRLAPSH